MTFRSVLALGALIAAALGAASTAWHYFVTHDYGRRKETTAFILAYRSSSEFKALEDLQRMWRSEPFVGLRSDLVANRNNPTLRMSLAQDYHDQLAEKVRQEFSDQFVSASRGLNDMAECAMNEFCDSKIICDSYAVQMQSFRCNFH
jgi:hypothetical protein